MIFHFNILCSGGLWILKFTFYYFFLNILRFAVLQSLLLHLLITKINAILWLWRINNNLSIIQNLVCLTIESLKRFPLCCAITSISMIVRRTLMVTWSVYTIARSLLTLVWIFELRRTCCLSFFIRLLLNANSLILTLILQ